MGTSEGQRPMKAVPANPSSVSGPPLTKAAPGAAAFGIPTEEFTPRVRAALSALTQEVESLRHETETLHKQLEHVAQTADRDALLPIFNRRAFVREAGRSIALAKRYGTPSSILFFDIDGFKAVNDACGHAGGDAALRHFANVIAGQIREADIFARLGGDEFGVILMQVAFDQAEKKGASLADALGQNPPQWNGEAVSLSFSYGATELRADDDPERAIERADKAMYAQKRQRLGPLTR
jgi:diguanylate cyclase (GGDEF)-like protein